MYKRQLRTFVFAHCGGDLSHWQANARGVDLNHNFDAGFDIARRQVEQTGIYLPGPTKYGGPFPFSEPETRALADFCRLYAPRQVVALHSQGEEIYYQYGPRTPKQSALAVSYTHLLAGACQQLPRAQAENQSQIGLASSSAL